jgi:hypothetical protein
MKKSHFYSGLLVNPLPLSALCNSLSLAPSTAQAQNNQAVLSTTSENRRRIPGWQFDDPTHLKTIKANAAQPWTTIWGKKLSGLIIGKNNRNLFHKIIKMSFHYYLE